MELDLNQIKDILDAFEERNMHKLELKKGDFEISLERSPRDTIQSTPYYQQMNMPAPQYHSQFSQNTPLITQAAAPVLEETNVRFISSPMVGTFYASSSPENPPFLKVGDMVKEGQVVGIIEAMKVMNEVKSNQSGKVKEVLIENGHPIEFGTKLFKIG